MLDNKKDYRGVKVSFKNKFLIVGGTFCLCFISIMCIVYFNVEPVIKINGNKNIVLNLNDTYQEKGSHASILGKSVSDDIEIIGNVDTGKVGTYELRYYISNKFIKKDNFVTRVVNVVDNINPEIKLTGEKVSIYVGDVYSEPGYSAIDNYDGDITKNVVVSDNINNTKVGTYEVIYTVVDSSNNRIEVKREVDVKERPVVKPVVTATTDSSFTNKSFSGNGVPVLMYHYFYDESMGEIGNDNNWMEISAFEQQLKYLDDNDYYFPTWSELADFVDGKISLPKKSIVITIDDGDASFFNKAIPVINKYDVKVTSFLITSLTSDSHISQYKSEKVNFQSHTHDMHKGGCSGGHGGLFRCIDYNKGVEDLNKSIQIIGSNDAIAYPFGDVTDNVLNITKTVEFKLGFTTKYGMVYKGMDKLQLPRVRMSKGISLNGFINSIT